MQSLAIHPRWLIVSAALVAILLAISVSSGMALGNAPSGSDRPGRFDANGQRSCDQRLLDGPPSLANSTIDVTTALASALDLSSGQLQQQLTTGQSLGQILSAHGMSSRQLSDDVISVIRDQLESQVAYGRITLDQEDAVLASERAAINDVLAGKTPLTSSYDRGGVNVGQRGSGPPQPCGG